MPATLAELQTEVEHLSLAEQMELMEVLLQSIRRRTLPSLVNETDLAAMAADPEIRRELSAIDAEFAVTEYDGLDRV